MGGTPFPGEDERSPSLWKAPWGTPLYQDWMGVLLLLGLDGGTPPNWDWIGVPPIVTGWRYPHQNWEWGYPPPPIETGWGYPPSGDWETEQLRGGQYASCLNAGGLSCIFFFFFFFFCNMNEPKG